MSLSAKKLAECLAWHAVAYQSIKTAENQEELEEEARETLHITTDALAVVLPVAEQLRLSNELPKSELETEATKKENLDDIIRYIFVGRLLEFAECAYVPSFITERLENPSKRLSKPPMPFEFGG